MDNYQRRLARYARFDQGSGQRDQPQERSVSQSRYTCPRRNAELDTFAVDEALEGMALLSLGYETHNGHNIVDLFEKDFFFGANVYFRAWIQYVIGMKSYATIISALWYSLHFQPHLVSSG